jgi:hypothetical protein
MGTRIENLTDKPFWLRLNSGESLVVPAREHSRPVAEHEIKDNPSLAKLADRRMARSIADAATPSADPAHSEKPKPRRSGEAHS